MNKKYLIIFLAIISVLVAYLFVAKFNKEFAQSSCSLEFVQSGGTRIYYLVCSSNGIIISKTRVSAPASPPPSPPPPVFNPPHFSVHTITLSLGCSGLTWSIINAGPGDSVVGYTGGYITDITQSNIQIASLPPESTPTGTYGSFLPLIETNLTYYRDSFTATVNIKYAAGGQPPSTVTSPQFNFISCTPPPPIITGGTGSPPPSPGSIIEQYIINSFSEYRGTSKQVQLKEQSLTSVPSIFQYSIYNNDINGGSGGTLCTFYPGSSNQYEYFPPSKVNYNGTNPGTCN